MAFDIKYSEVFSGFIQSVHVTFDTCVAKMVQFMWTSRAAESKGRQNEYYKWKNYNQTMKNVN